MSDEDFEPFVGGPPPDPSERTWRHPSEIAAQAQRDAAAAANRPSRGPRALLDWRPVSSANVLIAGSLGAAACLAAIAVVQVTGNGQPPADLRTSEMAAPVHHEGLDLGSAAGATGVAPPITTIPVATTLTLPSSIVPTPVISPIAAATAEEQLVGIMTGSELEANGVLVDGYLITSATAVGDRLSVSYTDDGDSALAYLVGVDPFSDLAVFRPSTESRAERALQALSSNLAAGGETEPTAASLPPTIETGDVVMSAALNEDGFDSALGVVLAIGTGGTTNDGQALIDLIDTTLRQPTLAGSALLDIEGNVIGIIVDTSSSLASAVDINDAVAIADRLTEQGWASETWIGFIGVDQNNGVEVVDVTAGGPAEDAGLMPGDVVRFLDGASIEHMGGITAGLRRAQPGDTIVVIVERGDDLIALRIEASSYPTDVSEPAGE